MRVVVAPDSFKESLSALEAAEAIAEGVRAASPEAEVVLAPMADGGEGTVEAVVAARRGEWASVRVTGPLGEATDAAYGLVDGGDTAVMEMAQASGLMLVPRGQRDPRRTTTRGTGEMMADALDRGVQRIIIGIGGSATNDGGAGMARALGYRLLDGEGRELGPGGAALVGLEHVDASGVHTRLRGCTVRVACDVRNPLTGPEGASHVYGPQKGADAQAVEELDAALARFAKVVRRDLGVDVETAPGAGAAGGLGAGLMAFAGATLEPGLPLVADLCRLADALQEADLVFTGEGRLDAQSAYGKTPAGVARMAREAGAGPVVALCGSLGEGYERLYEEGVAAAMSILKAPMNLEEAMERAGELLSEAAAAATRLFMAGLRAPVREAP
jgi:glycerate kinase